MTHHWPNSHQFWRTRRVIVTGGWKITPKPYTKKVAGHCFGKRWFKMISLNEEPPL
jgi:hypothetical protein